MTFGTPKEAFNKEARGARPRRKAIDFFMTAIKDEDRKSIVKFLDKYPASIDVLSNNEGNGWTGLFLASSLGKKSIAELLLDHGAAVNKKLPYDEETALHGAVQGNYLDIAELLLARGADVNAKTRSGKATPLVKAALLGHENILKLLLKNEDVVADKESLCSALHSAIWKGNSRIKVIDMLLKHDPSFDLRTRDLGRTTLMLAVALGRADIVKRVLEKGADITVRDFSGNTAFMLAGMYGHYSIAKLLLRKGAVLEDRNNAGDTAAVLAREMRKFEMADWLEQRPEQQRKRRARWEARQLARDIADYSPALKGPIPARGTFRFPSKP